MRFNLLFKTSFLNLIFSLLVPFVSYTNELKYIFKSGSDGYNTFRIPSIITTDSGVVLAFAEGRKNSSSDSGDIDSTFNRIIAIKRSGASSQRLANVWKSFGFT